jgi:leucyl aminopeptidase
MNVSLEPAGWQGGYDLLAVLVQQGNMEAALADLDAALGGLIAHLRAEDWSGKAGSHTMVPTLGRIPAKKVLLLGVGAGAASEIRAAAGSAGDLARKAGAKRAGLAYPGQALGGEALSGALEAFAEGNYRFDKYKAEGSRKAGCESLSLVGLDGSAATLARAEAMMAGQALTRDLVNEPAAEIYPASLARVAEGLATEGISVTVLDEVAIREKGMGGITGVGQASSRPPRFVHMTYSPGGEAGGSPGGGSEGSVVLIGKGVTFDAGGLSIKPNDGMLTMRCDMAGAAAVIGAMKAIAALKPSVTVHGIFGAVENMVAGNSYKLGDILHMYNGKRVEIHNTDAEGRLVLADCLAYASALKPDAIIDLATLTGAAVIALGDWYSAVYSKSDVLAGEILAAAEASGEGAWRMPLPELYKDKLKAEWGDLKNVGGRAGGSITAALFLQEFVDAPQWAHIDIAGPAFLDSSLMHYCPGATGTMVRTLCRWVEKRAGS